MTEVWQDCWRKLFDSLKKVDAAHLTDKEKDDTKLKQKTEEFLS